MNHCVYVTGGASGKMLRKIPENTRLGPVPVRVDMPPTATAYATASTTPLEYLLKILAVSVELCSNSSCNNPLLTDSSSLLVLGALMDSSWCADCCGSSAETACLEFCTLCTTPTAMGIIMMAVAVLEMNMLTNAGPAQKPSRRKRGFIFSPPKASSVFNARRLWQLYFSTASARMKDPRKREIVSFMYALATSSAVVIRSKGKRNMGRSAVMATGTASVSHHTHTHSRMANMEANLCVVSICSWVSPCDVRKMEYTSRAEAGPAAMEMFSYNQVEGVAAAWNVVVVAPPVICCCCRRLLFVCSSRYSVLDIFQILLDVWFCYFELFEVFPSQ